MKSRQRRVVYSTEAGRICPGCQRPKAECVCQAKPAGDTDGVVRVTRETKGRKGKGVTVVSGIAQHALADIGKRLRKTCGTGGTVKAGRIEIQGEHTSTVVRTLAALGYDTRPRAGTLD